MSSTLVSPWASTKEAFAKLRRGTTKNDPQTCPNPWPEPEKSIGTFEAKLGSLNCWKTVGPAREAWEQIYPKVKSHLETYTEPLANTSIIWIYRMIGSTPKASAPTIIFCCEEKVHRKAAKRAIANSDVLIEYDGIRLADLPRVPGSTGTLVAMSGNSPPAEDWMVADWTSNDGPPTERSTSTYDLSSIEEWTSDDWPPDNVSLSSSVDSTATLRPDVKLQSERGTHETKSHPSAHQQQSSALSQTTSDPMAHSNTNQMLVPVKDEYKAYVFCEAGRIKPGQSLAVQRDAWNGIMSTTTIGGVVYINGIPCLMTAAHPFVENSSSAFITEETYNALSFSDSDSEVDQDDYMHVTQLSTHAGGEPNVRTQQELWKLQEVPAYHFRCAPLMLNQPAPPLEKKVELHDWDAGLGFWTQDMSPQTPVHNFLRTPLILNQPTKGKIAAPRQTPKQNVRQPDRYAVREWDGTTQDNAHQIPGYYFLQPPLVLNQPARGELKAVGKSLNHGIWNFHDHIGADGRLLFSSIVDSKPELDYALILPHTESVDYDDAILIPRRQMGAFEIPEYTGRERLRCLESDDVTAAVASAGLVRGRIDSTAAFIRPPNTRKYQEVYSTKFESALEVGDCGSWVTDTKSQALHGHVIAGSPQDGLAYIVPAYQVFEDLSHFFTRDRLKQYLTPGNRSQL